MPGRPGLEANNSYKQGLGPDNRSSTIAQEPAGTWELGRVALVLGIWCVLGLVLCVRTFTWQDRTDR